jgi:uncharacterized membrane protein YdfJ with MMPL/SSD domain
VILVIIALLLRAIVAPLVLVITTALSFAASFGLSSLLWRYALGFSGIEAQLPLYIFVFLVALGVDYNIFLSARIREETRSSGTRQGVLRGLGVTGGVITAAGIVLGGTFAALAQLPSASIAEVGTAVALGVLLDTLLVRTVLVPASLLAIGERAWWPARPWGERGSRGRQGKMTSVAETTRTDVTGIPSPRQRSRTYSRSDGLRSSRWFRLSTGPFLGLRAFLALGLAVASTAGGVMLRLSPAVSIC